MGKSDQGAGWAMAVSCKWNCSAPYVAVALGPCSDELLKRLSAPPFELTPPPLSTQAIADNASSSMIRNIHSASFLFNVFFI